MLNKIKYNLKKIRFLLRKNRFKKYYNNSIDHNLIIFSSMHGKSYNDSVKYLYLELLNNPKYSNYHFIWAFNNPLEYTYLINNRTRVISYLSDEYFECLSKAKYIFTSTRIIDGFEFKPNQVYVQTWHGSPLKKLGVDIVETSNARTSTLDYQLMNQNDSYRIKYFLSQNSFSTEKFISAFELKETCSILELGYPRNDLLFNYNQDDINRIKDSLNIDYNKKIILYTPTWRENSLNMNKYQDEEVIDFDKILNELNNEYLILYRSHYMSSNNINNKNIIDVSKYDDISELFIISDLLITDYSSTFFDYSNLKRPIIFYMYDYDKYLNNTRGVYQEVLDDLPGVIVKDESSLIEAIRNNKVSDNIDYFTNKYCLNDNKDSSKKVLERIIQK